MSSLAKKYRKKPVVVRAVQFDGTFKSFEAICNEFPNLKNALLVRDSVDLNNICHWEIQTLEGTHIVSKNDFIIEGVKGEYYPCKPDVFKETYEEVKEDDYD